MAVIEHDIKLGNTGGDCPDISVLNGDLEGEVGIETAALISIFTDRVVEIQNLPDGMEDPRGWWADSLNANQDRIGSTLWTLERSKILPENLESWKTAIQESLQWMIDDGLADSISVEVEIVEED